MNTSTSPFVWQGRIDSDDSGITTRWHQHMRAFSAQTRGGVTLLGFAVDEGVQRNLGRTGAAQGPDALRSALCNMPVLNEVALYDAGNVHLPPEPHTTSDALTEAQHTLAQQIAQVLTQGSCPIVLGGGHEVAWGSFLGIQQALASSATQAHQHRLLIVNLDAHFDLREAHRPNSGTPFRQIHDWCKAHDQAFLYRVLGASRFANTQALFKRAAQMGAKYWLDEDLQTKAEAATALNALGADIAACDAVYLTVCLDVLAACQAPGVSAPATLGVPLSVVEILINGILCSGKVVLCDVAELNPSLDRDNLTARVAARLVTRMVRGLS